MKKMNLLAWFMLLCVFGCLPVQAQQEKKVSIKMVSFNVWNGLTKEPSCRVNLVKWMKENKPDVVAMQELKGFTEESLAALAKEYGHAYSAIARKNAHQVGITSNRPIEVKNVLLWEGYWNGMLHVKTYGIDFIVSHMSPYEWKARLTEAKLITEYIKANRLRKCVAMGDYNAHSPFDADEMEQHKMLMERYVKGEKNPKVNNMRDNHLDYSALSQMYAGGMRDVIQKFVPAKKRMTYPAAYLTGDKNGSKALLQKQERLDFILVTDKLMPLCESAAVHNDKSAEGISDHYPISVVMRLP